MEQLIKEETQKLLANQMQQARKQRQIQVRQQAIAWTESTRKKFEDSKQKEIRDLADVVTNQVQQAALQNIEHLTMLNDLAMAEIGMAHRAAAGFKNVERLKSLKRLKNDEVAKNRGSTATIRQLKHNEVERSKSIAIIKRKEDVRKAEDKLSKDLISRKPLSVSNLNVPSKEKLRPPKYHQSIANTLRVASTDETGTTQKQSLPKPTKSKSEHKVGFKKPTLLTRDASDPTLIDERQSTESKEGILKTMIRIKATAASRANTEDTPVKYILTGYMLRSKYMDATRGIRRTPSVPSTVRYFDATIPKSEVNYIAPEGLAVKESRSSPDAWEKGRISSEQLLQQRQDEVLKREEITQKAEERGMMALKKAKLEKELKKVRKELLEEIEFEVLGSGSQKAILGLDESEDVADSTKIPNPNESQSSDEFLGVDSDEEFVFPTPKHPTLRSYDVLHDSTRNNDIILEQQSMSNKGLGKRIESRTSRNKSQSKISSSSGSDQSPINLKIKQITDSSQSQPNRSRTSGHDMPNSDESSALMNLKIIGNSSSTPPHTDNSMSSTASVPVQSTGRYLDESIPKSEVNYVAPEGLAVKDSRSSPDALKKGRISSEKLLQQRQDEVLKQEEITQKAEGRGKMVPQKAKLEKEPSKVKKELLEKIDFEVPVSGSQKAILGLDESEDVADTTKIQNPDENLSSDEYLEVESDEELVFPTPQHPTLKSYDVLHDPAKNKDIILEQRSVSSSSTIAEINVKTTSANAIRSDHKISSLQDLQSKAQEQEKLLSSTSLSDLQNETTNSSNKVESPSTETSDSIPQSKVRLVKRIESRTSRKKSQSKISSISGSDQSSALINLKIKQISDSSQSQSSRSRTSGHDITNSDESSALVNLKIIENSSSTPPRTDNSMSSTTDYYSPPDGPFTSTPDGKLHPKTSLHSNEESLNELDRMNDAKSRTLYHYLNKFLKRRPESIDNLPVSSSSSSIIRVDSDVISSEHGNETRSSTSSHKSTSISDSNNSSNNSRSVLHSDRTEDDSGSTIAATTIKAGNVVDRNTTTDTNFSRRNVSNAERSSNDSGELTSSDSLTGLLRVLSSHQEIERKQLEYLNIRDDSSSYEHTPPPSTTSDNVTITRSNQQSNGMLDSSGGSIPDVSAILRDLRSRARQTRPKSSGSSSSSSRKSGPDKETKRLENLDDMTPVKLWETPPQVNQRGSNGTEKLSAVFENLIDKWTNLRIEKPPPGTPNSDKTQDES